MAKNFTDFQELTGKFTASGATNLTGVTETDTTSGMYVVGYDTQIPGGERRFTVESLLLAAKPYHVELENVENISTGDLLHNTNLTGYTTAGDLKIYGNLHVLGDEVILQTTTQATSSLDITNSGSRVALRVNQNGAQPIAHFMDGTEPALMINDGAFVGIGLIGDEDAGLTISPPTAESIALSALGHIHVSGAVDGRHVWEDGAKLDTIQPYAHNVTSLSAVHSKLTYLKSQGYNITTVQKGFDILEDGDDFKKVATLSGSNANCSVEKITSIEDGADVTGDHSADITFNLIPDGPSTGDNTTPYVKVTSAEHIRLVNVRGVISDLYDADGASRPDDDGLDINKDHIKHAYHVAYPDYWSTTNEAEYRSTIVPAATAAVHNTDGQHRPDGDADLATLNVTSSLSASDVHISSPISVLSGGNWTPGINSDVNAGGTWLRFIDGILVDTAAGTGNGGNTNPF